MPRRLVIEDTEANTSPRRTEVHRDSPRYCRTDQLRLRVSHARAKDDLLSRAALGMEVADTVWAMYKRQRHDGSFGPDSVQPLREIARPWIEETSVALDGVFPTSLERRNFTSIQGGPTYPEGENLHVSGLVQAIRAKAAYLDRLRSEGVDSYTGIPVAAILYAEQVDSFSRVGDINPKEVLDLVPDGYLDVSEDAVQRGIESALGVPFHKTDWAGERLDLYTSNLRLFGRRAAGAFLLKGPGVGRHEMRLDDLGKRADQLQRLFEVPADIYVVQYVGPISEAVIKDLSERVELARSRGREVVGCPIDGQDTARLLRAFGSI
jgi:hypothetical protein